ncbi:MAG: hypothetical protein EXS50_01735 [Candidatus Taylorbacteria bacterium]|nr:hypothetical protein [Candidatus Taylorbacteria bacterium]
MNKFITPIILVLIAAGIFYFYINPQWLVVKSLQTTNAEYNNTIKQSNKLLAVRDTLRDKYNAFKGEDLQRLEKLLPDNIDNVRLIIDINSITAKYGASIKNVKLSTGEKSDGNAQAYNSMILSFGVSASYSTFMTILTELEKSLRIIDVTSISFKATDVEPYTYDVSIRTYWLQ